jgi:RNase P/RNase MRP subunit POP5
MIGPTPLLDFFKRGEVARDVRLLAAQGGLAPRAHEQLAILLLLLDDPDAEIRAAADATINRIPVEALKAFLARSDVAVDVREFFGDRGIFPAEIPAIEIDAPLLDTDADQEADVAAEGDDDAVREGTAQKIAAMNFPQRLKAAVKGTKEMRALLIRDPNKMIAAAVLSSPKVTDQEVESFARMANVTEDVLRIIGANRSWMKNYGVVVGLARNPKTPVSIAMNLLSRLNDRDVQMVSMDRNVSGTLRIAARKKVADATSKK